MTSRISEAGRIRKIANAVKACSHRRQRNVINLRECLFWIELYTALAGLNYIFILPRPHGQGCNISPLRGLSDT